MKLYEWALKWEIPLDAIAELQQIFGIYEPKIPNDKKEFSEMEILNRVRLEASKKGARLWRNNVGATYDQNGNFIRYGLANESTALSKVLKSSDLIGIKPVLITSEMVGVIIGQFIAREVKSSHWKYSESEREKAQLNFIQLISNLGGDACFATDDKTIK